MGDSCNLDAGVRTNVEMETRMQHFISFILVSQIELL